jgi:hypothetical protein
MTQRETRDVQQITPIRPTPSVMWICPQLGDKIPTVAGTTGRPPWAGAGLACSNTQQRWHAPLCHISMLND